jgi:Non-repetitive/WGA-negative nucleoporin C-terminal
MLSSPIVLILTTRAGEATFKRLINLQYRGLITTKEGRDVARALVTAVINQQIAQQTSVGPVSCFVLEFPLHRVIG